MSKATVQFIELVRQAYHNPRREETTRRYYCQVCGSDTRHTVSMSGDYETFRCQQCGTSSQVKTR